MNPSEANAGIPAAGLGRQIRQTACTILEQMQELTSAPKQDIHPQRAASSDSSLGVYRNKLVLIQEGFLLDGNTVFQNLRDRICK